MPGNTESKPAEPVIAEADQALRQRFLFDDTQDLWRQSRPAADHGLFAVVEGIYQVRGFDLSNMTLVEGEQDVLVIDPLLCAETAAAALAHDEATLRTVLLGATTPDELADRSDVEITGDPAKPAELLGHLGAPDPDFAIVTP
ncbi:alkyl sulfatase C-terminal domain-containing protein [Streptomyces sp. NPDC127197]|uniref:alkyl sulfatase C-terminal domain-containing protein n=1 Tax=Streptomyces sp. NPDC127197 TaxID=3345388 RepID=UPI003644523B